MIQTSTKWSESVSEHSAARNRESHKAAEQKPEVDPGKGLKVDGLTVTQGPGELMDLVGVSYIFFKHGEAKKWYQLYETSALETTLSILAHSNNNSEPDNINNNKGTDD